LADKGLSQRLRLEVRAKREGCHATGFKFR
jgi:hypothetical protein